MAKNVTVMADENGVQREYNEVKRKANVGERIKMLDTCPVGGYHSGDTFDVKSVWDGSVGFIDIDGDTRSTAERRYLVLEPTSTVIIGGVRYTEEKRKARVGEKVLIVKSYHSNFKPGAICNVVDNGLADDSIYAESLGEHQFVDDGEYVVLTPIDAPKTAEPAPTATVPQVINLTLTVNIQPGADVAQAVADAVKAELHKREVSKTAGDFVSYAYDLLGIAKASKTPQELRDEIVERAKADVAELVDELRYASSPYPFGAMRGRGHQRVEFVINRDKRTVVALIRNAYCGDEVDARGIAKCAPGDVFNSAIGRAIALRRALGLEVPAEYTNAPQPTEVRVGDRVLFRNDTWTVQPPNNVSGRRYKWEDRELAVDSPAAKTVKILDDSREEVSA